ncbi:MAG: hypothetical protein IM599_03515 [Chitinophagaceae bacterium]|nr:hypothetical protein [Chitinophagaceae bacterium]
MILQATNTSNYSDLRNNEGGACLMKKEYSGWQPEQEPEKAEKKTNVDEKQKIGT